jgi:hypothetical protein
MINRSLESSDTSDWKFALGPTLYCIRSGLIFLHVARHRNEEVISLFFDEKWKETINPSE